jgi:hypothetical protein
VWDLEILARERDAYVETVLADGDAEAYLARLAFPADEAAIRLMARDR